MISCSTFAGLVPEVRPPACQAEGLTGTQVIYRYHTRDCKCICECKLEMQTWARADHSCTALAGPVTGSQRGNPFCDAPSISAHILGMPFMPLLIFQVISFCAVIFGFNFCFTPGPSAPLEQLDKAKLPRKQSPVRFAWVQLEFLSPPSTKHTFFKPVWSESEVKLIGVYTRPVTRAKNQKWNGPRSERVQRDFFDKRVTAAGMRPISTPALLDDSHSLQISVSKSHILGRSRCN